MMPETMYQALLAESRKIGTFGHGFTYSGHPVPAAVALKTMEIYRRDRIVEHAAARAPQLQARLAALGAHPLVGEARGLGLIGGVELVADKTHQALVRRRARRRRPRRGVRRSRGPDRALGDRRRASRCARRLSSRRPKSTHCSTGSRRALDRTLDWVTRERLARV